MIITLDKVGKRFRQHRIFKDVSYTFTGPGSYAVLGHNGSGKSTLLRMVAGMQGATVGKISYTGPTGTPIPANALHSHMILCAPGQEIVEEFTLREFLAFHFSLCPLLPGITNESIMEITGLSAAADKPLYDFSSGMKQRVKLAQAIFANREVLLLDEPCTNLDEKGVAQYREWVDRYTGDRLVIVASNDPREYDFCAATLELEKFA